MDAEKPQFPMRINKYLASQKLCTRREADKLIEKGLVILNGRPAVLGDKVQEKDKVEVKWRQTKYRYFAYYKPRGIITHSAQEGEEEIKEILPIEGVFPLGRLDKDSYGLIILTDDGRITDALLNPDRAHEKEYEVMTTEPLPSNFKTKMERGVDIGGYVTKPCTVETLGDRKFSITLTEGKKHQIRRMCGFFGLATSHLLRKRIMNIKLGGLKSGEHRAIQGAELDAFLKSLGL
ncbi:MAG: pseudouridine synthase [bacterium]|nr:pseudouridine synthase [bacterium]